MKLLPHILFSFFLCFAAAVSAAELKLTAPPDGAELDTVSPLEHEFLESDAQRAVVPEKIRIRLENYDKDLAAFKAEQEKAKAEGREVTMRDPTYWADFRGNDWSDDFMKRYKAENADFRPLTWTVEGEVTDQTVLFSETEDFADPLHTYTLTNSARPENLKLGVKYFWKVTAKDENGQTVESDVRTFTTLDRFPRFMSSVWIMNFRDLGGGVNADGKKVRQGLVYRSAALHRNAYTKDPRAQSKDEMLYFFRDVLKLKCEFDLRGVNETQARWDAGEPKLEPDFRRINFPMGAYNLKSDGVKKYLVQIFHTMATEDVFPMFFHCAGGADRTGTVGVMLDGVIGRDDQTIIDQYELTTLCGHTRMRICRLPGILFSNLKEFGPDEPIRVQVVKYLLSIGVPQEEIDAVHSRLVEE
ncbi:MAG: tyrosine-protein phosphatase [Thermoguttaceae bacterium]|nr:tyrosine-protein phosphatase [Thermoguttaceae bacterium]